MLGRPFIATTKPTVYMHCLAIKLSAPKFVITIKEDCPPVLCHNNEG